MDIDQEVTRILIVEEDESSFEFRRCLADKLEELPPIELFHARDATEALALIESLCPDVLVIDDDNPDESELLIDSLDPEHLPVVFCTENVDQAIRVLVGANDVTCIQRNESIEGLHQTLRVAAALGVQALVEKKSTSIH